MSTHVAPSGVRARARRAVQAEAAQVAVGLLLSQGFDRTTVDQLAQAAGMSRATFFRYFPTKEDVVLWGAADFAGHLLTALAGRPDDEPVWQALRRALDPVVHAYGQDDDLALQVTRLMQDTPSIRARQHEKTRVWQDALAPEVARRLEVTDPADPRPVALTACALACLDAALDVWLVHDPGSLASVLDTAMFGVVPA